MSDARADNDSIAVGGNVGDGSVTGDGTIVSGVHRGQVGVGAGNTQQVSVALRDSNDTRPLNETQTGIVLRLGGLETMFGKFSELQAEQWDRFDSQLQAIIRQQSELIQAGAIRLVEDRIDRERFSKLEENVLDLQHIVKGNGSLGTAVWERITRTIAIVCALVVAFLVVAVVLQGVNMIQLQQQMSYMLETIP
jgi:hypothetical protein